MSDSHPTRDGQDLLSAYREHAGPTPQAEARLLAALQRARASDQSLATGPSGHAPKDTPIAPLAIAARRRRPWRTAAALLVAAAVVAAVALRAELGASSERATDPAAAYQVAPGTSDIATPRRPVEPDHARLPTPRPVPHTIPDHVAPPPPPTPPELAPAPREPAHRARRDAAPPPSLADEMRSMRPAQRALAAGDPIAALAQLERYAAQFPAGHLREEYLAMHAIARCDAGHDAGPDEAATFLRERPLSIFAERVRNACVR